MSFCELLRVAVNLFQLLFLEENQWPSAGLFGRKASEGEGEEGRERMREKVSERREEE